MVRESEPSQADHEYNIGPDQRPSEAVIATVAAVTDRSPLAMAPLVETIDTDALDEMFASANEPASLLTVTFQYATCQVTLSAETVEVEVLDK